MQSHVARDAVRTVKVQFVLGPAAPTDAADLVRHAVNSFQFLIQRNEQLTMLDFANRIEQHCCASNPQTAAVLDALRASH